MQNKSNNTEIITVVASIAAFLVGTGIIDVDLNKVVQVSTQAKEIAEGIDTSSVKSIVEGIYRIICLILGGGIIMSYLKYKAAKEQKVIIQKVPEAEPKPEILVEEDEDDKDEVVFTEEEPQTTDVVEDVGADEEYGLRR